MEYLLYITCILSIYCISILHLYILPLKCKYKAYKIDISMQYVCNSYCIVVAYLCHIYCISYDLYFKLIACILNNSI